MKPLSPHDPMDDLIAAALHGELTPEERTQLDSRLQTDPAAQAAYQEAQAMHDLLEKTHKSAQPDSAFEQRMVSGVLRKLQSEPHRETALESLVALWSGLKSIFAIKRKPLAPAWQYAIALLIIIPILAGVALGPITSGTKQAQQSVEVQEGHAIAMAEYQAQVNAGVPNPVMKGVRALPDGRIVEESDADGSEVDITGKVKEFSKTGVIPVDRNGATPRIALNTNTGGTTAAGVTTTITEGATIISGNQDRDGTDTATTSPISGPRDATSVGVTTPPAATTPVAPGFDPGSTYSYKSSNDMASLDDLRQANKLHASNQMQLESNPPVLVDKLVAADKAKIDAPNAASDTRKLIRN